MDRMEARDQPMLGGCVDVLPRLLPILSLLHFRHWIMLEFRFLHTSLQGFLVVKDIAVESGVVRCGLAGKNEKRKFEYNAKECYLYPYVTFFAGELLSMISINRNFSH